MKVKVAQCWDDGVYTDLRLLEILRKYGAKATFNLNPGNAPEVTRNTSWTTFAERSKRWNHLGFDAGKIATSDWKKVYGGFKVASHCWCHEGAGKVPDEVFVDSALRTRHFLEDLFEMPCPGFAWPGGWNTPETVKLLRDAGFAYGRTTEYTDDITQCDDLLSFKSNCHYQSGRFMDKYLHAKETSGVFYFWGHSYEMMDSEGLWDQLEQKIRFISEDPDAEWCDVIDLVPLCSR